MLYSKELVSDVNRCHFHPVGYDVPELYIVNYKLLQKIILNIEYKRGDTIGRKL
jgi:hypothetical protein